MATAAIWIGGIFLALLFWFLFLTFPRTVGSILLGLLLVVFGMQILPWLGFSIGEYSHSLGCFLTFYFFGILASVYLDYKSARCNIRCWRQRKE